MWLRVFYVLVFVHVFRVVVGFCFSWWVCMVLGLVRWLGVVVVVRQVKLWIFGWFGRGFVLVLVVQVGRSGLGFVSVV